MIKKKGGWKGKGISNGEKVHAQVKEEGEKNHKATIVQDKNPTEGAVSRGRGPFEMSPVKESGEA